MRVRRATRWLLAATLVLLLAACAEERDEAALDPAPYPHAASPPAKQVAAVTGEEPTPSPGQASAEQGQNKSTESTDPPGREVYEQNCASCHGQGIAGAPTLEDTEAWEPRIAKGMETLYDHAVNGFQGDAGMMPPKGGNPSLSKEQVQAAVRFMVQSVQSR